MAIPRKRKAESEPESESTDTEMEVESDLETAEKRNAEEVVDLGPTAPKPAKRNHSDSESCFVGSPIPHSEAVQRYPRRYKPESKEKKEDKSGRGNEVRDDGDEEEDWQAKRHFSQAKVDGVVYNLYDDAYVMAEEGKKDYIARIVEFFEGVDGELYFKAQWYYRPEDTAIKVLKDIPLAFDEKRVFLSEMKNTNSLDSILSKVNIVKVSAKLDVEAKAKAAAECDLYYDMKYLLQNLTFLVADDDDNEKGCGESLSRQDSDAMSTLSSDNSSGDVANGIEQCPEIVQNKPEMSLLDLYSGCGAMSTGLCIGAYLSGVKLVTRWAVDVNQYACQSLKLNHPEAEVRNEPAEDFLELLKAWHSLCKELNVIESESEKEDSNKESNVGEEGGEDVDDDDDDVEDGDNSSSEFEVEKLLAVCHGDPNEEKKPGLYFKVRWKGYDESEDTWEPLDGLSDCKDKLQEFVKAGYNKKIIPLPGDVDFICGGPPCQGISGFNRFRNQKSLFSDKKNFQVQVYFDIIQFLKPRYSLMENVVDILKFSDSIYGRYAIGRLVAMNYQCRIGQMAAGCYGVPQYRCRVFLWGAHPSEKLPPYPLPTHKVHQNRGNLSKEFEDLIIGHETRAELLQLDEPLCLKDALHDLPPVENDESRDEVPYGPKSELKFHRFMSLPRHKVAGYEDTTPQEAMLFDHQPLKLNQDDFERVQKIPKKKGANFRDLEGVLVGSDNKVYLDPSVERPLVTSGKPLVPDYAISFIQGRSLKPFGRLWWDEIITTVVTRAEPHNQIIIHPIQDRVLTIRELARLQGFPDFYKLCGPVKQRYIQVGNAVAVPVGAGLGYALGKASQGQCTSHPVIKLPFKFPECLLSTQDQ